MSEESRDSVWVGNITPEMAEEELKELFAKFGAVRLVEIPNGRTIRRLYAFVHFEKEESVEKAIAESEKLVLRGVTLIVKAASKPSRPPPTFEREHPPFEREHPPFERRPPPFERRPPPFEREHPPFERRPPPFERELPLLPPPYDPYDPYMSRRPPPEFFDEMEPRYRYDDDFPRPRMPPPYRRFPYDEEMYPQYSRMREYYPPPMRYPRGGMK